MGEGVPIRAQLGVLSQRKTFNIIYIMRSSRAIIYVTKELPCQPPAEDRALESGHEQEARFFGFRGRESGHEADAGNSAEAARKANCGQP
jgi:hypothetical protein